MSLSIQPDPCWLCPAIIFKFAETATAVEHFKRAGMGRNCWGLGREAAAASQLGIFSASTERSVRANTKFESRRSISP